MSDRFPRCAAATNDGRRCFKHPDHQDNHLVLPLDVSRIRDAFLRIKAERPDVRQDVLSATVNDEGADIMGKIAQEIRKRRQGRQWSEIMAAVEHIGGKS